MISDYTIHNLITTNGEHDFGSHGYGFIAECKPVVDNQSIRVVGTVSRAAIDCLVSGKYF